MITSPRLMIRLAPITVSDPRATERLEENESRVVRSLIAPGRNGRLPKVHSGKNIDNCGQPEARDLTCRPSSLREDHR